MDYYKKSRSLGATLLIWVMVRETNQALVQNGLQGHYQRPSPGADEHWVSSQEEERTMSQKISNFSASTYRCVPGKQDISPL